MKKKHAKENLDFPVEFHAGTREMTNAMKTYVTATLHDLARGHHDLTGASVALRPVSGDPSDDRFLARVVLYHKDQNLAATHKHDHPEQALEEALDEVKRQVREYRAKMRDKRRRQRHKHDALSAEPIAAAIDLVDDLDDPLDEIDELDL